MGSKADAVVAGEIPTERHGHVRKLLERPAGPFCHSLFEPSENLFEFFSSNAKVLVVGAGGLGCELLKCLSLMGFKQLHVIDMDTIDISNLNRQFLFRMSDVGRSKADTAAAFINKRVQGAQVVAHHCKIQDKDDDFYRSFHVIVCGLDSIVARRWLNSMVLSLLEYDEDGKLKEESVIPMVDGGTEGFKGNARVILPGTSPCIECTLDLYPPQVNFPLCTIANTPRLPEHCIEYVRILLWPKENPFDPETAIDGDDPNHINWIYEKSLERASQFGITGVTYRLTQGVVKRIIPAVASTNAVIAAACATEVFKLATACCVSMDNYMVFSDTDGIYTYTYKAERKENCIACSREVTTLEFPPNITLQQVIDYLKDDADYQMKNPGVTTVLNGKNKTLYTHAIKVTEGNLSKKMTELGVIHGGIVTVADETTPAARDFKISYVNAGME